jgi:rhodanese-related sulfurtransferase
MPIPQTRPADVKALLEQGYQIVDVRSVPEFEGGHPAGAANVPLLHMIPGRGMSPNPTFTDVMARAYKTSDKLVLVCGSGGRSMKAGEVLASIGFTDLLNLDGGYGAWTRAGQPVEKDAPGRTWDDIQKK